LIAGLEEVTTGTVLIGEHYVTRIPPAKRLWHSHISVACKFKG
jgi:ABC-type sugar transport system ATPase subunit